MNILLLRAPLIVEKKESDVAILPPMGLAYIAAFIREKGFHVRILDMMIESKKRVHYNDGFDCVGMEFEKLKEILLSYNPDIIGITWQYTNQSDITEESISLIKTVLPNSVIVVGGAHVSACPKECLENDGIDFAVIGEGEETFLNFLNQFKNKKDFSSLDGFGYKKGGKIIINPKTKYIEDLDKLPMPAHDLLPMQKYFEYYKKRVFKLKHHNLGFIVTSRGCPGICTFCSIHSIWGCKWRSRSPENIIKEVKKLVNEYDIKEIHFLDDNLLFDRDRSKKIFQSIVNNGINIYWRTPNGVAVNKIDEELIVLMKASGCYHLSLAIESGNNYILNKVIKKGLYLPHVRDVVRLIKKYGIGVDGFFVIGMPGENRATIFDTIIFASKLDLDGAGFYSAQPYPGTELLKICEEKGYINIKDVRKLKTSSASIETSSLSKYELNLLQKIADGYFIITRSINHPKKLLVFKDFKRFGITFASFSIALGKLYLYNILHRFKRII